MYSVFFKILSSWEVIVTIFVILLIMPFTFYITSHYKDETFHYIGISKKKSTYRTKKAGESTKGNPENRTENRRRQRYDAGDSEESNKDDEEDRAKYEVLKRLKGLK